MYSIPMVMEKQSPGAVCFSDGNLFKTQTISKRRGSQTPDSPLPVRETLKHLIKVMVRDIISCKDPGNLYVVEGMMNKTQYPHVIRTRMLPQLLKWFILTDLAIQSEPFRKLPGVIKNRFCQQTQKKSAHHQHHMDLVPRR